MTLSEADEYLSRYRVIIEEIEMLEREYDLASDSATATQSPTAGGGSRSSPTDKVGRNATEMADIELKIMRYQDFADKTKEEIISAVNRLEDKRAKYILISKYIKFRTMREISEMLYLDLRHTKRLKKAAIELFAKNYDDC